MFRSDRGAAFLILSCLLMQINPRLFAQSPADPRELPTFQSAPTLVGQVVDAAGKAIPDADVYLLKNPDGAFTLPVEPLHTKTAPDGEFVFADAAAGGYQIWAETSDATSLVKKLRGRRVEIVKGDTPNTGTLQIELHPGCGFDITVLGIEGRPVPGADISFGWTDIDRHYLTAADGVARIRNLAMDEWFVVARAEGLATKWFKTSKQNLGSVLPLEFRLEPGGGLRIEVVDGTGTPIPDTDVFVGSAGQSMSPYYTQAKTDAKGVILCEDLPLDERVRIYATKEGYEHVIREVSVVGKATVAETQLSLKRKPYGGDVRIHVFDSQGNPIEGAELVNRGNSSNDVRRAHTNAQGEALLQDVQKSYAGVVIVAKAAGFVAQEAQVEPGSKEQPGELRFELRPGNTLRGRITNPEGEAMPKLRVYYDRGENGDLKGGRVDTDDDGRFELSGLGPEVIFTVYTPPEYAPIQQLVLRTDLDELMELTLVPTGLLRVRALDSKTGQPIPAFNVRIGFCEAMQPGDLSPKGVRSTLIQDGVNIQGDTREFRLDNQVTGTAFKVIVSADGYESATIARMVTQSAESAECVDVPLVQQDIRNFQIVAGQLLDSERRPIVGAAVRLLSGRAIPGPRVQLPGIPRQQMGGWSYYHWDLLKRNDIENRDQCEQFLRAVSDQNGMFRFENVKRDTPWLELFYTGDQILAQRYSNLRERDAAELRKLVLVAERPSELKVEVSRDAYPTAAQIYVEAENWSNGINAVKLPYSYEYRDLAETNMFNNLPAGTYRISLRTKNRPVGDGGFTSDTLASESITIAPGQKLEIDFK